MAFFVEELKQAFKPVNESCEYSKPYNDAKKSADKKAKEKVEAKSPENVKINPTGPAKEDNTSEPVDESVKLTEMQKYKEKTGMKYPDKRMSYPHEDSKEASRFYKKEFGGDNGFARGFAKNRDHESNTPQFLPDEDSLKGAQNDLDKVRELKANSKWARGFANGEKQVPSYVTDNRDFKADADRFDSETQGILNKHRALRRKNESVKRVSAMSLLEGAFPWERSASSEQISKEDFISAIRQFVDAWDNLATIFYCDVDGVGDVNDIISDKYPFDKSFDEIPIDDWYESIMIALKQ